jgi:hypothetical protein
MTNSENKVQYNVKVLKVDVHALKKHQEEGSEGFERPAQP